MNIRARLFMLIFVFAFFTGCSGNKLENAEFTNTTPAVIEMNGTTYSMSDKTLSANEIDIQIGKITKVNAIVSYLEENDPYKNPRKIFKLKNVKAEEAIAVEVNEKLYKAIVEE